MQTLLNCLHVDMIVQNNMFHVKLLFLVIVQRKYLAAVAVVSLDIIQRQFTINN